MLFTALYPPECSSVIFIMSFSKSREFAVLQEKKGLIFATQSALELRLALEVTVKDWRCGRLTQANLLPLEGELSSWDRNYREHQDYACISSQVQSSSLEFMLVDQVLLL